MISVATATIDLAAVQHNLKVIQGYAPNAKVMAVIKANGYGHGLLRIASMLGDADALAVARVDEGVRLRQAGFQHRITILEGFVGLDGLQSLVDSTLDTVVHSMDQVSALENYTGEKKISIWLKLDTGMNRLGFNTTDFSQAYQRLLHCPCVNQPISFMTHLSSADDLNSPVTQQQIELFKQQTKQYSGEKSIANSAGIMAWKESVTDWIRPGIMLYGVSPFLEKTGSEVGLKPVMGFHSRIISINHIAQGESVGYSGSWVSKRASIIGVIAVGYGDGYPRHAQIGTPVLVNGKKVLLVGRVSMDMITVDLTDVSEVNIGDEVTLWGDDLPVEEIARYADTIPYTLLCGVTQRVAIKSV